MNIFKSLMIYFFQDYKRSYKYITPLLVYVILIACTYAIKPDYVMSSYALTCIYVYMIAAWLAFSFIDNEDIVQQQLTILHIKKDNIYYLCKILFIWFFILILSIIAVFYPILTKAFIRDVVASDIIVAIISHAIIGLLGVVIGSLFSSRIIKDRRMAVLSLVLLLTISIIQKPLVQLWYFFKYIITIFPPAYLILNNIGTINYVTTDNVFGIVYAFVIALIYLTILIVFFISLMKRKLF